ncbi:hypothetical protein MIB92_18775 [Aestuariirhabdus sp. Z084]|uniref:hypothetical protein n=1 Tax=Aestuariirhabdus haliotis TaxID=2918751 RepID=UPI00201B36E6|nr:hypothetical protein [Aestuariirhabdus haliotis]MCL6417711.1 hypothetical protein [Aestuariirhabdus haliotis]MCL6421658.1 hypothetical protein [Aestuariirhabdus haliotis]
MNDAVVSIPLCVKTPKGIEAVEQRMHGLPARVRQVLIMVDGKRDTDDLVNLFPGDGTQSSLEHLLNEGFITPLEKEQTKSGFGFSFGKSAPSEGPKPKDDNERLELARNFMVNTTRTFIGFTGDAFIAEIEACQSIGELQGLFDTWRETIRQNPEGSSRMSEMEPRLAALIS